MWSCVLTSLSLQMLDWTSEVFREEQQFGVMQGMLKTFAGGMRIAPLTADSLHTGKITCFMSVHFGVSPFRYVESR